MGADATQENLYCKQKICTCESAQAKVEEVGIGKTLSVSGAKIVNKQTRKGRNRAEIRTATSKTACDFTVRAE